MFMATNYYKILLKLQTGIYFGDGYLQQETLWLDTKLPQVTRTKASASCIVSSNPLLLANEEWR
jgi:hypothetical protein